MYFTITSPIYAKSGTGRVCPMCGAYESDILRTGKVGCAKCYEFFADILDPYIQRIFGNAEHVGKAPGGASPEVLKARELVKLKNQLKTAISEENYEQAAVFRDQIAKLEADGDE